MNNKEKLFSQLRPRIRSQATELPADANPDGKLYLLASKIMKESEKHIYFRQVTLVSMYYLFYGGSINSFFCIPRRLWAVFAPEIGVNKKLVE